MTEKNKHIEDKTIRHYGEEALREEAEAILDQIALLDDNFEKAVDLMYHCEGKIIVTGVGKSGHVGAKIAATLASTGTPAFYINPLDVYHGDLGVMTDKDVVLALSNSGQTDELLRFIPMVLHMNVPIISMTGNPHSCEVTSTKPQACLSAHSLPYIYVHAQEPARHPADSQPSLPFPYAQTAGWLQPL